MRLPPESRRDAVAVAGVQWSLTYVGFLGYIFAITTYRFPIGDVSIVFALIGLLMQKEPTSRARAPQGARVVLLLWAMVGYSVDALPAAGVRRLEIMVKLWLIALVAANALRTRDSRSGSSSSSGSRASRSIPCAARSSTTTSITRTLFGRAIWNYIFDESERPRGVLHPQLSHGARAATRSRRKGPVRLGARLGHGRGAVPDPAHEVARRIPRLRRLPAVRA